MSKTIDIGTTRICGPTTTCMCLNSNLVLFSSVMYLSIRTDIYTHTYLIDISKELIQEPLTYKDRKNLLKRGLFDISVLQ